MLFGKWYRISKCDLLWTCLILVLSLFLSQAPLVRSVHAEPGREDVLNATLENGLRVIIVRNSLSPVVTTMVNYLVGSDEAPGGFPGMPFGR